jgi:hypothetical protein
VTDERIKGALMGAFIGDAMGVGVHWYYDLDEMRRDSENTLDVCKILYTYLQGFPLYWTYDFGQIHTP